MREKLSPEDYAILRTKLLTNKVQLDFRAPMVLAVLHYRRMMDTDSEAERDAMDSAIRQDLASVREAASPVYGPPRTITYLGKTWNVGPPEDVDREAIFHWAYQMDQLRRGEDPRSSRAHRGSKEPQWNRMVHTLFPPTQPADE